MSVTEVKNLRFRHHNHEVLLTFLFSFFCTHLFSDVGAQTLNFILEPMASLSWFFDRRLMQIFVCVERLRVDDRFWRNFDGLVSFFDVVIEVMWLINFIYCTTPYSIFQITLLESMLLDFFEWIFIDWVSSERLFYCGVIESKLLVQVFIYGLLGRQQLVLEKRSRVQLFITGHIRLLNGRPQSMEAHVRRRWMLVLIWYTLVD